MSISQYLRTTGVPPAGGSRTQGLTLAGAEHLLAVPQRFQVLTPQNASGKGILLLFKALSCELSLQASIKKKKMKGRNRLQNDAYRRKAKEKFSF